MLLLLSLVLPCLGPQADESGGDSVRGLSPLNSRCSHTETGRLFGGQSKVGVRRLRGREDWAHLVFLGVSGRSPRCTGSHICVHLCLSCPSISGCLCPYIPAFPYPSYSASWDCGPWCRHSKLQLRLVSPLPRPPPSTCFFPHIGLH